MKYFTTLLFVSILIFAGCGDDSVNNGGNNPVVIDSLLFSKDSISIYLPTGGFGSQETVYSTIQDTSYLNVRIQFTASGQGGGNINSKVSYRVDAPIDEFCNLTYVVDSTITSTTSFGYDYSFINMYPATACEVRFLIQAGSGGNLIPCWIKLKNIKIYKSIN